MSYCIKYAFVFRKQKVKNKSLKMKNKIASGGFFSFFLRFRLCVLFLCRMAFFSSIIIIPSCLCVCFSVLNMVRLSINKDQ